jgi:hypothetical protein
LRGSMSVEHGGGGAPKREPTPSEAKRPENNQPTLEVGEGRHGVPPPQGEQAEALQESPERQALPSVWDVLERKVRIEEEFSSNRMTRLEYYRELGEVNQLLDEIGEKGTARDRLIEPLYNAITMEPTGMLPNPVTSRELTLEEFQQFRSKVEPMSNKEIRKEIRKAWEEYKRKSAAKPLPPFPKAGHV